MARITVLFGIYILGLILFRSYSETRDNIQPVAVVIPHHDIVKGKRQELVRVIAQKRPLINTIIIVGPNHFSPFQWGISYSDIDNPANFKFTTLLSLDNNVVQSDHAISNLLPELKDVWPNAKIIPILIGQNLPLEKLDPLISDIVDNCRQDCLLIASVDFSHYLPATLANVHDQTSIRTLTNLDIKNINNLEVDSPQSLYILAKFSLQKSAPKFTLFSHTNTGFIDNNPDAETTSHVFGYYTRGSSQSSSVSTNTVFPQTIDSKHNQDTLGQRFFYGSDSYSIDGAYPGFIVSTVTTDLHIEKSFLPLSQSGQEFTFLRGPQKQLAIKKLFDSLEDNKIINKDYFWGTLKYEQR